MRRICFLTTEQICSIKLHFTFYLLQSLRRIRLYIEVFIVSALNAPTRLFVESGVFVIARLLCVLCVACRVLIFSIRKHLYYLVPQISIFILTFTREIIIWITYCIFETCITTLYITMLCNSK